MKLTRYGHEIDTLGKHDRYQLVRELGSGGMAEVWLARDTKVQRPVAIKVIKENALDQGTVDQFIEESRHVASLDHPHILRIYDQLRLHVLSAGKGLVPYIVMEYAEGGDLRSRLTQDEPYDYEKSLSIIEQIGQALQYAHDHGLLHRDVKPHNILFRRLQDGSEQAVLSDFGIAVRTDSTHSSSARHGTPAYMALEHMYGEAEKRSDLYSLSVVLYRLLTGILPDRLALQAASTRNPNVPPALDALVLAALDPHPKNRPASVQAFIDQLGRVGHGGHDKSVRTYPNLQVQPAPTLSPASGLRQSSGADILGPDDPHANDIGLIYVSPTDDKESVIIAVFMQEMRGRKQIAIVLPEQSAVAWDHREIDDLERVQLKLKAQIIVITSNPITSIALALMRFSGENVQPFPSYASLEDYKRVLQPIGPESLDLSKASSAPLPVAPLWGNEPEIIVLDGSMNLRRSRASSTSARRPRQPLEESRDTAPSTREKVEVVRAQRERKGALTFDTKSVKAPATGDNQPKRVTLPTLSDLRYIRADDLKELGLKATEIFCICIGWIIMMVIIYLIMEFLLSILGIKIGMVPMHEIAAWRVLL